MEQLPRTHLYLNEPDYQNKKLEVETSFRKRVFRRMTFLYGEYTAKQFYPELERILRVHYAYKSDELLTIEKNIIQDNLFTEKDIILITYGDLLKGKDRSPLSTLARFCDIYLEGAINTIHILPFYPYSSDRGFSIKDFEIVDPKLGSWEEIHRIGKKYRLMFDGVINHISSKSKWFQEFLNGNPRFADFVISYDSPNELADDERKLIFRPRTSDILSKFVSINGDKYVWTTFSEDQIDLNYKNPEVLIKVIEILLMYVRHGANIIRLDAVTYIWAEAGTRCIHLDQTHEIVKLFRDVLDYVAPGTIIITETNVPHNENISYFGNGFDEAHMVYNFALPPLVLHTMYTMNSKRLTEWAMTLNTQSNSTTFFNFLDSHDGIGLMAVKEILEPEEINFILDNVQQHGGFISYKSSEDGSEIPYEMNITWYSAINNTTNPDNNDIAYQVKKFVASRSIALALKGVPGIYLHSLIGTVNDIDAVVSSQAKRDINRTIIDEQEISFALGDGLSKISRINREYGRIIDIRTNHSAFHPNSEQKVLFKSESLFTVLRYTNTGKKEDIVFSLINISNQVTHTEINLDDVETEAQEWTDLISGVIYGFEDRSLSLTLQPYDVIWLSPLDNAAGDHRL
ncbi:MAG: sugar phosphorylase [Spirochaetes bacterium]|nr:sugar phosphorylase [Spirochaetota bacterium]